MADILRGGAQVIRAEGDYLVKFQEAKIVREQVRAARLENRKKEWEQWAWEQDFKENYKWIAIERDAKATLHQGLESSPTKIIDGWSLNVLRDVLSKNKGKFTSNKTVSLDGIVPKINMTTEAIGRVNIGLLQLEALPWPLLLRKDYFTAIRESADQNHFTIREEVLVKGNYPAATFGALRTNLNALEKMCQEMVKNPKSEEEVVSCDDSINANRFLKELKRLLTAMEGDTTGLSIKRIREPVQATTVAELVDQMDQKGIKFGPALQGNEQFYYALHNKLAEAVRNLGLDPTLSTGK
jgi:hypothetical protein